MARELSDIIPLVDMRAEYEKHGQSIISAMTAVVKSGKFILGPEVAELEATLSSYVQGETDPERPVHCIAVSDGTSALHLCLLALQVGYRDEIITPTFTWISPAEVIPLSDATTVFAEIEPDTYLLDATRLSTYCTQKTRAVIVVSLFGLMPDLLRLRAELDRAQARFGTRIAIIEDAAQSFGAVRGGHRSCGSPLVTLSTTSFFPTKPLSCYGDGGAVFTRDERLAKQIRSLRVHGKMDGLHKAIGINGRLDTIQAAVILTKFRFFEESLAARRAAAERYHRLLGEDLRVVLPTYKRIKDVDGSVESAYGVYTVRVMERDAVVKKLKAAGVSCAVYYARCCHQQPVFSKDASFHISELASEQVVSLPIHAYLTQAVQERVVKELRTALDDLGVTEPPSVNELLR